MKTKLITLACAVVAPVAFAQTSTTTTEQSTTTAPVATERTTTTTVPTTTTESSATYSAGTVTTYEPGRSIIVRGPEGPLSFALGTAANVVDAAGKVVTAPIRAGQRVRVYYNGPTEKRVVQRVVVED